jgi:hypothetical protein
MSVMSKKKDWQNEMGVYQVEDLTNERLMTLYNSLSRKTLEETEHRELRGAMEDELHRRGLL